MVLAFEPLVFETGFNFGMQIKDVVVIRDGGCELLSNFTNTDRMIVVK
jgi:Xaa-Pro dipeptidase